MTLPGLFNLLDLVAVLLVIIAMGVGYAQGMLRQIIVLASLYIAAILAAQYYTVVAGMLRFFYPGPPTRTGNAFGFFIILIVVMSLINWLAFDAYRSTKLRIFPIVDHLGGAVLGLLTGIIIVTILIPILTFAAGEPWPWAEATRVDISNALATSRLLPVFDYLKPTLLNALSPWLPHGLPSLFNL